MVEFKNMGSSSPVRTPKLKLSAEQLSIGECWIPPKKDIPHPRAKEKPRNMVGGVKSCLKSNPIPTRDARRAQTRPCAHQETPQTDKTCL